MNVTDIDTQLQFEDSLSVGRFPTPSQLRRWRRAYPGKPLHPIEAEAIERHLSPHGLTSDEILALPVEFGLTLLEESRLHGRDDIETTREEIGTFTTRLRREQYEAEQANAKWENQLARIQSELAKLDRLRQARKVVSK